MLLNFDRSEMPRALQHMLARDQADDDVGDVPVMAVA